MIVQQNEKHVLLIYRGWEQDRQRQKGVERGGAGYGRQEVLTGSAVQLTKFGCCTVDFLNGQFLVDYYVNQIYM